MWNVYVNRLLAGVILMQLLMVLSEFQFRYPQVRLTKLNSNWTCPREVARCSRGSTTDPHGDRLQGVHVPHRGVPVPILHP